MEMSGNVISRSILPTGNTAEGKIINNKSKIRKLDYENDVLGWTDD